MKKLFNIIIILLIALAILMLVSCKNNSENNTENTNSETGTKNDKENNDTIEDISKKVEDKVKEAESEIENTKNKKTSIDLLGRKNLIEELELEAVLKNKESVQINIAIPIGSPALTLARVIDNKGFSEKVQANIKLLDGPVQIPSILIKEEYPFVFMPLNLASKMYNKGIDYKLLNVVVWGSFNILSSNPEIKSWDDLKGQDLYLFGEGSTPDILTQYFLKIKGIDPNKDLNLIYRQANQNAQLLIAGKIETALVPEPVSTQAQMKNSKLKPIIDYNKEWEKIVKGQKSIAQAGIMVNGDYAKNNPEIVKIFEQLYQKEIEAFYEKPEMFGKLGTKNKIVPSAEIVENSYERLGIKYKTAEKAIDEVKEYLNTLYEFNPQVIGGKMPSDDFFYHK